MDVILSDRKTDVQECEVLVSGFFEDERPLRGTSGWLDWRLNGLLSRFLIHKRLIGTWKETILIPSQGRILAPLILLVGSSCGAQIGTRISKRLKGDQIKILLAVIILVVMVQMLFGLVLSPKLLLSYKGGH